MSLYYSTRLMSTDAQALKKVNALRQWYFEAVKRALSLIKWPSLGLTEKLRINVTPLRS